MPIEGLRPEWDAPTGVASLMSTRLGGVSRAPFDALNLGRMSGAGGDEPSAVAENRRRFADALGARPVFLHQVHGTGVVELGARFDEPPVADASVTTTPGLACTVMVADCLPVLYCAAGGRAVGAAHAGWRGLAAGVLENTLAAICRLADCGPTEVSCWLGPCIGPRQFEVGADVLEAFDALAEPATAQAFVPRRRADGSQRWLADLPALARLRLQKAGVSRLSGGRWCTVEDRLRFFSFRRDGLTGRMAAAIAIRV